MPRSIDEQLNAPLDPQGEPIQWEHPFLIFLAEHGRVPPSEQVIQERARIFKVGRSVGKSTKRRYIDPRLLLPTPYAATPLYLGESAREREERE